MPRPNVTWYLDNTVIDETFEHRPDGKTVNHLSYPNIGRQHVNARLVCMASNTNLTPPSNKVVILDVNRKCCAQPQMGGIMIRRALPSHLFDYPEHVFISLSCTVKPLVAQISTKDKFVSADKSYDIECMSTGSKPAATVTWWRDNKQIKRLIKNVSRRIYILEPIHCAVHANIAQSLAHHLTDPHIASASIYCANFIFHLNGIFCQ